MRKSVGWEFDSRKSEADTFAASMHSSIRRWASLRSTRTMRSILPLSSKIMRVSTESKSMAPRLARAESSDLKTAYRFSMFGTTACGIGGSAGCPAIRAATRV
jgi:hypothetical protein